MPVGLFGSTSSTVHAGQLTFVPTVLSLDFLALEVSPVILIFANTHISNMLLYMDGFRTTKAFLASFLMLSGPILIAMDEAAKELIIEKLAGNSIFGLNHFI